MLTKKYISKEEISNLPILKHPQPVRIIVNNEQMDRACEELANKKLLGFDTETKPSFTKGERYDISLLQLASDECTYLFRINKQPMSKLLIKILADESVVKTGVAVTDDIKGLQRLAEFTPGGFVDLATEAKAREIKNLGLNGLTALFFGQRLVKKTKTSNWQRQRLTDSQVHYAALDAWVSLQIYKKMVLEE
jgi:ribonuclease D